MNKINVLDHGFVILRNLAGPTRRSFLEFDDVALVEDAVLSGQVFNPHFIKED